MQSDSIPREEPPGIPIGETGDSLSRKAIDHFNAPRNLGEFQNADGIGRASIDCGDSMQVSVRVSQDRVLEARFMADGCGPVIACGSMATELIRGLTVSEAMALSESDIIAGLADLPESEMHCATLAVKAVRQALIDYLALRREPWKRTYRQIEPFEPCR